MINSNNLTFKRDTELDDVSRLNLSLSRSLNKPKINEASSSFAVSKQTASEKD